MKFIAAIALTAAITVQAPTSEDSLV
jgi:hypothetical protein